MNQRIKKLAFCKRTNISRGCSNLILEYYYNFIIYEHYLKKLAKLFVNLTSKKDTNNLTS